MSENLKKQTEQEITEFERRMEEERKEAENDACTHCGAKCTTFPYNEFLVFPGEKLFGWLECPFCGQVFCPLSVRVKKAKLYGINRKGEGEGTLIT